MDYIVVGKLDIAESDYQWIQSFRKEHDELNYNAIYPHFTFVFPTHNISEQEFRAEVLKKLKGVKPIKFCVRCATINKGAFNEYWHVFLVPDEGYSEIIRLHDKLYSEVLSDTLYLEIPFIPHIGIGNSKDKWKCKILVDDLNASDIKISGTIKTIVIAASEPEVVQSIEEIELM